MSGMSWLGLIFCAPFLIGVPGMRTPGSQMYQGQGTAPGQKPAASVVSSAEGAIDIPEGTQVIFHIYGGNVAFALSSDFNNSPAFFHVIQVDKDVMIDNKVVVPRGSLGQIKVDPPIHGKYRSRYFSGKGTSGYSFTPQYVFSIASTRLEFVGEQLMIDAKHNNVEYGRNGVLPLNDAEFSAGLKHASVAVPR